MDTARNNTGFTLVELIIVLAIFTIIGVVLTIKWIGLGVNVNAQAVVLADDIRNTQTLAMSRSERYRLTQLSASSYQIYNSTNVLHATVNLAPNIVFGAFTNLANNSIIFSSNGTPFVGNVFPGTLLVTNASISLVATDNSVATVTINPFTGSVVP